MEIKIEVDGLAELKRGMERLPDKAAKALKQAVKDDLKSVASYLSSYPSARPGSTYQRTGNLGYGWLAASADIMPGATGLEFQAVIGNQVEYTGFVQGGNSDTPHQANVHRGRWQTTDQALAATDAKAQANLEKAIQGVLEELGKESN